MCPKDIIALSPTRDTKLLKLLCAVVIASVTPYRGFIMGNGLRFVFAVTAILFSPSVVLAQASGDGFQGPRVFNDQALDQSLAAMNRELRLSYARKDAIEDLVTPAAPDFVSLAADIGVEAEEIESTASLSTDSFAESVSGDASLDAKVASIRETLSDDEAYLFVNVARLATGDLDNRFDDGEVAFTSFGPAIDGDETLQAKVVHVTDLIAPASADAVTNIETPVPPFTDASLQSYTDALATPPTQL